jgi:formiminotetrahydrofolate cyclodeaminase
VPSRPERYTSLRLPDLLEAIASDDPVPGGGAVAAMTGASGAALIAMACRILLLRPRYADHIAELASLIARADGLRERLTRLVGVDAAAYLSLIEALQLPRRDARDQASRRAAITMAIGPAMRAPLEIARACADLDYLAGTVEELGSGALFRNVRVARRLAHAAADAALETAEQNLPLVRDSLNRERLENEVAALRARHALEAVDAPV